MTKHALESISERFPQYSAFDKATIETLLSFAFKKSTRIGGQFGEDIMYQVPFGNEKIYFPCIENKHQIVIKTMLTEKMALANIARHYAKTSLNSLFSKG